MGGTVGPRRDPRQSNLRRDTGAAAPGTPAFLPLPKLLEFALLPGADPRTGRASRPAGGVWGHA